MTWLVSVGSLAVFAFVLIGIWVIRPITGTLFAEPTGDDRDRWAWRRSRVPFRLWLGLGVGGAVLIAIAATLR